MLFPVCFSIFSNFFFFNFSIKKAGKQFPPLECFLPWNFSISRWWNRLHSTFFLCSTNLEKKNILSLQCLSVLLLDEIMPSWDCVCGRLLYFLYHRVCFSVVLTFVSSEVISSGNIKLCRRPHHSPPCSEENGGSVELHPFIVITCAG